MLQTVTPVLNNLKRGNYAVEDDRNHDGFCDGLVAGLSNNLGPCMRRSVHAMSGVTRVSVFWQ